jgi:hypothetical protein
MIVTIQHGERNTTKLLVAAITGGGILAVIKPAHAESVEIPEGDSIRLGYFSPEDTERYIKYVEGEGEGPEVPEEKENEENAEKEEKSIDNETAI